MKKQIVTGVLAVFAAAMWTMPVMAKEFAGGKTDVAITVTGATTEGDAIYNVTVPTVLAITVDTSLEKPKVLIGGEGEVKDSTVGALAFRNNSKITENGITSDLDVALSKVKIQSGEGSNWKPASVAAALSNPYYMSFKFGENGDIMALPDGQFYTASIKNFVLSGADAAKELKVRADASGSSSEYQAESAAAAFYMEYWFTTVANQVTAAN